MGDCSTIYLSACKGFPGISLPTLAFTAYPEGFAGDTDHVARFQREAKLLASLNHANIAAIHGLEESSGTNFLVLELVEGQTLTDQIKTGIED